MSFFPADYAGNDRKFNSLPRGSDVYGSGQRGAPAQGRDGGMGRSVFAYEIREVWKNVLLIGHGGRNVRDDDKMRREPCQVWFCGTMNVLRVGDI